MIYMVKHIRYAGLRPSASENAPMNAGARPWKIINEVTVKLISVFETCKSAANVVSDG